MYAILMSILWMYLPSAFISYITSCFLGTLIFRYFRHSEFRQDKVSLFVAPAKRTIDRGRPNYQLVTCLPLNRRKVPELFNEISCFLYLAKFYWSIVIRQCSHSRATEWPSLHLMLKFSVKRKFCEVLWSWWCFQNFLTNWP